jgi:exopolysaccharide biosynthesis polyprenyl glycosylphosphotransferase
MIIHNKKIEKIPLLLIVFDFISITFSTRAFESYIFKQDISSDHSLARYAIFFIFPLLQLILNSYKPLSNDLRVGFISRYLIGCFVYFFIVTAVIATTEIRYIGNAWGRGWFFINILGFNFLGLISRIATNAYKNEVVDRSSLNLILIGSQKNLNLLLNELKTFDLNLNCSVYSKDFSPSHPIPFKNLTDELNLIQEIDKLEPRNINFIVIDNDFLLSIEAYNHLVESSVKGVNVFDLSNFVEIYSEKFPVLFTNPNWIITSGGFSFFNNPIQERLKTLMDYILCSIFFLPFLSIIFLFSILIKVTSRGPILFIQDRVGKNGKVFSLYKLRSMNLAPEAESVGKWSSENDPRITTVGKFIRKTRIDELPQIFNVLKREMSFIGPRPEQPIIVQNLNQQIPYYNLRHLVKPGLTGWAQVNYGYGSSVDDSRIKLEYDLFYIKNFSILLDFRIIVKTIRVIVFGRGR